MQKNNSLNSSDIIEPIDKMILEDFLESNKRYPVIAITGPAGVGKSTFTNLISDLLGAKVYTELPDNNPFLKIIKETKGKVSDQTLWLNNQNLFLATDIGQLTIGNIKAEKSPIVYDFALTQPFIFSDIQLSGQNLKSFNQMFDLQFNSIPKPDIVIEISADTEIILERLEKRGKHIDDFVQKMTEKLNNYYKNGIVEEKYNKSKVINISNNKQFSSKEDFQKLAFDIVEQIKKAS